MKKSGNAKFLFIAYDIADKIHKGDIKENEKLRGRSVLASRYNVSPETIRKAMILLSDMNIVRIVDKSGIIVESKENAEIFIQKYKVKKNLLDLKNNIKKKFEERQKIDNDILESLAEIETLAYPEKNLINLLIEFFPIEKSSPLLNNSAENMFFWEKTGATIVAVMRNNQLLTSPGQNIKLLNGDLVYYIGEEDTKERILKFNNSEI